MNRSDFQQLADARIEDARVLLDSSRFGAAYYLSGLSVECAIKACIAKGTNRHDFPDYKRAQKSHQHNLEQLVETAGIRGHLDDRLKNDPSFAVNGNTITQWTVESRYGTVTEADARELFSSVTESTNGVLPWLRTLW